MGLLKGNFTFMRFQAEESLPKNFPAFTDRQIKANAYRQETKSTREKNMGWVSLTDVLDADFKQASYSLGDYLIFSLRIDHKLISPKLLKLKLMEEERRHLAQSGSERIGKQTAATLKEKIETEILARQEAIPSFYDVLWSLGKKTVYFSSLADKVADDFTGLFKNTFSLNLKRLLPQDLINKPVRAETGETVSLIGREFLTWLWFKAQQRDGRITLAQSDEAELHFVKRIALEAGEGEYAQGVVCSGLHAELKEAKEALRLGKKVKEAGIMLMHDKNEWEFIFKADTFDFQSLKIPSMGTTESRQDKEGALLERIYLIEGAVKVMDDLFAAFLQARFQPGWSEEAKKMSGWLQK
ncbi:MAG TPA: recombination-associated protein RdgC [Smithellaceae bacterium]|nr:recombination-associated protein RdgC [Smithellaceae bacterium]HRS89044.1 recombination-associated protein RdgC [Smithellaceae bacterium]HRV25084.1 recombination-associated protein RdgC [Smithellaceae bacterium]